MSQQPPEDGSAGSAEQAGHDPNVLREPAMRDRYVRSRSRLTVRELMEHLDATPRHPQPAPDQGHPTNRWLDQSQPVYRTVDDGGPISDDVTQRIPVVRRRTDVPVDLSATATNRRVRTESRHQVLQRTPDPIEMAVKGSRGTRSRRDMLMRDLRVGGRVAATAACIIALVGTGAAWAMNGSLNSSWRTVKAINSDDHNIKKKDAQYGDENFLIVGTDTRAGKNSKFGAGDDTLTEGARSDTIILVNIPANRSRVVAVSFPRDLNVSHPECEGFNDQTGEYTGEWVPAEDNVKLNSVYAIGGPKCLVKTITMISGLNINHFIGMDFVAFRKIVDTVGGVWVCSPTPLYDYEIGTVLSKAGHQKLNGRKALKYVRARTISTEGNGDYGRIKRQQLFMSSLLRSTLSGNVISNPAKLNRVARTFTSNSYVDNVDTESLLNLADSMRGIEAGRVTFVTIPTSGTSEDGQNNELPRDDDIQALFSAIINDDPLPGEEPEKKSSEKKPVAKTGDPSPSAADTQTKVTVKAMSPSKVGVRILNGTPTSGLAAFASEQLTPEGFEVRGIADSSQNVEQTVVRYGPGQRAAAATVAQMFPGAKIQADRTVKSGVELILGSDFTMSTTLSSYATPGTKISVEQLPARKVEGNLPSDLAVTNAGDASCD